MRCVRGWLQFGPQNQGSETFPAFVAGTNHNWFFSFAKWLTWRQIKQVKKTQVWFHVWVKYRRRYYCAQMWSHPQCRSLSQCETEGSWQKFFLTSSVQMQQQKRRLMRPLWVLIGVINFLINRLEHFCKTAFSMADKIDTQITTIILSYFPSRRSFGLVSQFS